MAALLTVLLLVFTCGGPRYTNIAGVSCIVCVSCKYGVPRIHAYYAGRRGPESRDLPQTIPEVERLSKP